MRVDCFFGGGGERLWEIVVSVAEDGNSIDAHLKFFTRKPFVVLLEIVFEATLFRLDPGLHAKVPVNFGEVSIDQK